MEPPATPLELLLVEQTLVFLMLLNDLPDDEIDPDIAVKVAEGIVSDLHELDEPSRERFVGIARELAATWDRDEWHAPTGGDRLRIVVQSLELLRD